MLSWGPQHTSGSALQSSSNELSSQSVSHFSNISHLSYGPSTRHASLQRESRACACNSSNTTRRTASREGPQSGGAALAAGRIRAGINRSPQPCDEHKRAQVPLSCASALPRRRADHAILGQGPRPNKGQWNGIPGREIPGRGGDPGEESTGGQSPGTSHRGQSGIESEQGGGGAWHALFRRTVFPHKALRASSSHAGAR